MDCVPCIAAGSFPPPGTFIEGSSREHISAVGEARSSWADGLVLLGPGIGARLTVDTPGSPHGAATHVHPELPRQGLYAFILLPLHIALLHPHVCTEHSRHSQRKEELYRAF